MRFPWQKFLGDITEWIALSAVAGVLTLLLGWWPGLVVYLIVCFVYWAWRDRGGHE